MGQITGIPHRILNGSPVSSNTTITVYEAGTFTPLLLFSDEALTSPIANPLAVASGNPIPSLFHSFAGDVRVKATDGGSTIFDDDPYDRPVSQLKLASLSGGEMVGTDRGVSVQTELKDRGTVIDGQTLTAPLVLSPGGKYVGRGRADQVLMSNESNGVITPQPSGGDFNYFSETSDFFVQPAGAQTMSASSVYVQKRPDRNRPINPCSYQSKFGGRRQRAVARARGVVLRGGDRMRR